MRNAGVIWRVGYMKAALVLFFVFMVVASCNGEQYTDPLGGEWF